MSMLGAAGCGYKGVRVCPHLSGLGDNFTCLKFRVELDKERRTGEPLRAQTCLDEAWKDAESKLAIQRKLKGNTP